MFKPILRALGGLLVFCLALAAIPSHAQMSGSDKPPIYFYVAAWNVPRAQWPDMTKVDDMDKPILDKLVADGTLNGYGGYTNLIHVEGEPTHATWFSATSEGKLFKALEAIYAHPGSTNATVQANSKHWDQILTGTIYNAKPGSTTDGYLTWSTWVIKPGQMHAYIELSKKVIVPMLEKLLADGTITSYGQLNEDYHTGPIGTIYDYFTVPDTASLDKVNKAFDDLFTNTPGFMDAFENMAERDGHRDHMTRLRFMVNK